MKLASIETVEDVFLHPNADNLSIVKILGWQSIVKKGEFQKGEKVVFVVIDTILPKADWSAFLIDKKNPEKPIRLNTVKLRGEYSQGLVLPLSVLPENVQGWHEGADVGGALGVKKYEKEIPAQLSGEILGGFPNYICSQTDEDNGLSNPELVAEILKHEKLTITKKLDGSSCTIIIDDGKISQVCSRRLSLKETDSNSFWAAAKKIDAGYFIKGRNVIQGELMGPGIQGNQLKLMESELYVFQILNRNTIHGECKYHNYQNMVNVCNNIGAKVVPAIHDSLKSENITIQWLQELADKQILPNGKPAEGIVVRPSSYCNAGNGRPLSFKIINRNYKD